MAGNNRNQHFRNQYNNSICIESPGNININADEIYATGMSGTKQFGRILEKQAAREKQFVGLMREKRAELIVLEERLAKILPKETFVQTLRTVYKTLKYVERVPEPILISKIKKEVCQRLNISRENFEEFMQVIDRETENYKMTLIPPEHRDSGGVTIDGKYFHFMVVKEKEKFVSDAGIHR